MSVRVGIAGLMGLVLSSTYALAQDQGYVAGKVHGMHIFAYHPGTDRIGDIAATDAQTALQTIGAAIDRAYRGSEFARRRIDALRQTGQIEFIYDARHPEDVMTEVNIALYLPQYYDPEKGKHTFVVLIGRTGIQWNNDELAAAVSHELAGHAYQRLQGRLMEMRPLDAECEAYLVHEQTNQDIGADKSTTEAIGLRQATDYHWCDDFRRWTLSRDLSVAAEWDKLNPDIPALLKAFEIYIAEQD